METSVVCLEGGVKMIETLEQLYIAFDNLFRGIEKDCVKCKFSRCLGYVWLLAEEAERLIENGLEVLQINENLFFVNSFPVVEGEINIEQFKPKCSFLTDGRCGIYNQRPLSCRMYPLSFYIENGILQLVLHLDCLYSRHRMNCRIFKENSLAILQRVEKNLLKEIAETYRQVFAISKFPQGGNHCTVIGSLDFLYSERR